VFFKNGNSKVVVLVG